MDRAGVARLEIREGDDGATMPVRVRPRASSNAVAGERGGALLVQITAAPVAGVANAALTRFLGRALDLPPTSIRVLRGATSRDKLLAFDGLGAAALRDRLLRLEP